MRFGLGMALVGITLIAGCAAPPVKAPGTDFAANGRLAVRGEINGKTVSETANFRWRRSGERVEVELGSPLGETQAQLTFSPDEAEVRLPNGRTAQAADADSLLEETTGYAIPVTPLRWWIEGRPAPVLPVLDDGDTDTTTGRGFTQAGWHVALNNVSAQGFPKQLHLQRDALDVRIAITDWP
ncbi:lipoprotein insertase outer membrane protein LolB [Andreprevotia chitinilytica]|uniref:lipoprotein insertase outer membrane protein LolB n=1 Tax=Andreprevotia chitinilytica TaxID=396808 RepID=UPI0005562E97|nr:lipoprotein insertase outer membrane protein LolB [Andreprevotia chitinilytica]